MKNISVESPIIDSAACQPTTVPTAIPQSESKRPAIAAAAIRGAASRPAIGSSRRSSNGPGPGARPPVPGRAAAASPRPQPVRSSGIIRAASMPESVIPVISLPRLRSNPTPTTAPVPSTNVLP